MKIKFENDLQYQVDALSSVIDVFKGQEKLKSNFTVLSPGALGLGNDLGHANNLSLIERNIVENVQEIQLRNGLKISSPTVINKNDLQFSIDMETGTGKTYVFTRSIMEMNRRYGFTKFVIVVPSVSIREGINKSLQMTQEHFAKEFENTPYKFFIYDSANLSEVRDFATSDQIRIMIINIQAFSTTKNNRILLEYNDRLGAKPISLITQANPIVIVDEPQSTMSTGLQQESIKGLNPLAVFRYSATHKEKINTLFKFDAIDAYNDGKVKKIEVASITTNNEISDGAFIQWISVTNKNGISAKLLLDVKNKSGKVSRQRKEVKRGTDLYELTKLEQYYGFVVNEINAEYEFIEFTNGKLLKAGESMGAMDDMIVKRQLISKTIKEHLDKEVKLNKKGIKVLSLFFIDSVGKYKIYDEDGNVSNGEYAEIFEEEYNKLINTPRYKTMFKDELDTETPATDVHRGYFSIDKKGKKSNSKDKFEYFKDTSGTTAADEDTYELIMKDKERLLGFKEPVRFIFSHSALKEGWDNPNVFQICMLKDIGGSEIRRRQEVGRGLRIAVNQEGQRVYDENVNILTTVVNESFTDFVKGYQKELSDDTGIRFGYLEQHSFNNVVTDFDEEQNPILLGQKSSTRLFEHLKEYGYIDAKGKILDTLKVDLKENIVNLGEEFEEKVEKQILNIIKEVAGSLEIKNNDEREVVEINKEVYLSEDFKELWDSIKDKTIYQVEFDSDELIKQCIKSLNSNLMKKSTSVTFEKAILTVDKGGVASEDRPDIITEQVRTEVKSLPDIITYLQEETDLTRSSIVKILKGLEKGKIDFFKINPQAFIESCIEIINLKKRVFITDGIKYQRIGDDAYYNQKELEENELLVYLTDRLVDSEKSVYKKTLCDSMVEENLAKQFEDSENIKLYTKLPSWFTVPTPLGEYNPDWAVLYSKADGEKLYFITESKGSVFDEDLRPVEKAKIDCGKAHFSALSSRLILAHTIDDVHGQVD